MRAQSTNPGAEKIKVKLYLSRVLRSSKVNDPFSLICIDKLYWYSNATPPKNVPDAFFFNVDDVRVHIKYLIHYRFWSTKGITRTLDH